MANSRLSCDLSLLRRRNQWIDNADANFEASQRYGLDDLQPASWALQYATFNEFKRVAQGLHAKGARR